MPGKARPTSSAVRWEPILAERRRPPPQAEHLHDAAFLPQRPQTGPAAPAARPSLPEHSGQTAGWPQEAQETSGM